MLRECLHEAGHAIVASHLGFEVTSVTGSAVKYLYLPSANSDEAEKRLCIKLAGGEAEKLYYSRAKLDGLDMIEAKQLADLYAGGVGGLRRCRNRTRRILEDNIDELKQLAEKMADQHKSFVTGMVAQFANDESAVATLADEMVTAKEAAVTLGVNQSRIRQMAISGQLRGVKRGRDWLFDRHAVFLADKRNKNPGRPPKKK